MNLHISDVSIKCFVFRAIQPTRFLVSCVGQTSCSQSFSNVYWSSFQPSLDFVPVHQIESKVRCCSCCFPGQCAKCCGSSRISSEPIYLRPVLEFYVSSVLQRVRSTKNLVETISRSDVLKDCNFNFVD